MITIGVSILVVILVIALFNKRALKNLFSASKAQIGKVGRFARDADPLAMYKELIDDGLDNISKARLSLENVKTQVRSLERQVNDGVVEQARLENRIKAALANGDPNKTATEYAIQLESVERNIKINQEQLDRTKTMYESFNKTIQTNQQKVQDARREANSLHVQLEQSEREKELANFSTELSQDINISGSLSEAREAVLRNIDANRAACDVNADLNKQRILEAADDELERTERAKDILARFQSK